MVLFTRPIAREGAIWPPLGKPMRTYPFGVKIIQGVEIVNSSAKIQFQVNRSIFVAEIHSYVFACYVMFSFACCIFAASTQRLALQQNSNVSNVHGSKMLRCKQILCDVRFIYFSKKLTIFDAVFLRLGGAQKFSNTKKNPDSQEQPFSCSKRFSFKGGPQGPLPGTRTVNKKMNSATSNYSKC